MWESGLLLLLVMCYCASPLATEAVAVVVAVVAVAVAVGVVVGVAVADRADVERKVACQGRGLKGLQDLDPDQVSSLLNLRFAAEPS